jgi:nucleotide-binding universal stress UspA family protein
MNRGGGPQKAMFKRIAVAYNESPEARRALASAIHLARTLGAELRTVTIVQGLPAHMDSVAALDEVVTSDRLEAYDKLQCEAREAALREGVQLVPHLLEGDEVDTFVRFLVEYRTDLLVIGLLHYSSRISCLWSTVYELAHGAPCSVLGVH